MRKAPKKTRQDSTGDRPVVSSEKQKQATAPVRNVIRPYLYFLNEICSSYTFGTPYKLIQFSFKEKPNKRKS